GNAGLWRERIRSADARCRRGHADPRCADGKPGAGVPRLTARPGESPARRLAIETEFAPNVRAANPPPIDVLVLEIDQNLAVADPRDFRRASGRHRVKLPRQSGEGHHAQTEPGVERGD